MIYDSFTDTNVVLVHIKKFNKIIGFIQDKYTEGSAERVFSDVNTTVFDVFRVQKKIKNKK